MSAPDDRARLGAVLTVIAGELPASGEDFLALFRPTTLDKNEPWVRAGSSPKTIAFVREGLLRMFYTRDDGREVNKSFITEDGLCGALESLLDGAPTRLAIEALEPTRLLVADYARVTSFYAIDPYWERLGRIFAERLYVKKVRKEAQLLMDTAASRYERFLSEHPAVEARVPDYHIASYLGITPESLSRIKRSRRNEP